MGTALNFLCYAEKISLVAGLQLKRVVIKLLGEKAISEFKGKCLCVSHYTNDCQVPYENEFSLRLAFLER